MWDQLNKISQWINGVVDRVDYYLKVVKWGFNALKTISDILASFPRYNADESTKGKDNSDKRSESLSGSDGTSAEQK